MPPTRIKKATKTKYGIYDANKTQITGKVISVSTEIILISKSLVLFAFFTTCSLNPSNFISPLFFKIIWVLINQIKYYLLLNTYRIKQAAKYQKHLHKPKLCPVL